MRIEQVDKTPRPKIENNLFKLAKKKLTTGSSKDHSTPVLFNVVSTVQHQQQNNILKVSDMEYCQTINNTKEKYLKLMTYVYEDAYKSIKDIKLASIEPVINKIIKLF
jgi:hypothetical protein